MRLGVRKTLCSNCFEEIKENERCPYCGYDPSDIIGNPALLPPGSVLSEKYTIGGVIGMGGFGITYLGYDKSTARRVAVKEYFPRDIVHRGSFYTAVVTDDPETFDMGAEKFCDEAKMVLNFGESPHIVKIYDIFRANNTAYLVMEFLRGKTIKEYVRDCGALDAPRAVYAAQCVLSALSATHGAGVLHRDISPDNIILCANGDVKLIDFGAARRVVKERTQNFSTIVKHGFAPPEQYRKKTEQGAWSDVYSLGATMYYALTGDIPADPISRFDNDDTYNENNFGIDEELWEVITKATRLNSKERYQSAEEMRRALDGLSFEPQPVTFADKPFRPAFKPRAGSASGNVSAALGVAVGGEKRKFRVRYAAAAAIAVFCAAAAWVVFKRQTPKTEPPQTALSETSLSEISDSVSEPSNAPEPETPPVPLTETFPYFGEYETKAWYLGLDETERELYKTIYNKLTENRKLVRLPARKYTLETVQKCYYCCIYDNPWICNVGDFTKYFTDDNDNKKLDPDEYLTYIEPDYLDFEMDADALRGQIKRLTDVGGGAAEALLLVHDTMAREVSVVARYVNQSCTHAYGSIVHKVADDMGIAQGFCVYAQALGLPCRVIDGTKSGEVRAWCAVKIDDTWYNVDVYGDMFAHSAVDGNIYADRDAVFHTYFLANDEYFKEMGYVPNGGWEELGGDEFSADSPFDNYYIRCVENAEEYFNKDAQSAYNSLLEQTLKASENGETEVSACVAPYLVNELYSVMNDAFISDCKEKYGVSVSGYRVSYSPSAYNVQLTFES